jgi:hypothetical protein
MFARLSSAVVRLYSLRLMVGLLICAAFFFWLFNFSALPLSDPEMKRISNGEGLLDLRLYYSAQEAFRTIESYGAEGRALYLRFLAADFIFVPIYGLAFALLFTRLAIALWGRASSRLRVNLLPLGIALADFVENSCLLLLLAGYPEHSLFVGALAGMATLTKQMLTFSSLLFLAYSCLSLLTRGFGSGKKFTGTNK